MPPLRCRPCVAEPSLISDTVMHAEIVVIYQRLAVRTPIDLPDPPLSRTGIALAKEVMTGAHSSNKVARKACKQ